MHIIPNTTQLHLYIIEEILNLLKEKGNKITKVRKTLIIIFIENKNVYSVEELLKELRDRALNVNKTTVYRELEFLLLNNIITVINLGDNKKRYEILELENHHHHFICNNCKAIKHIKFNETFLEEEKTKLENKFNFLITSKILEFFGLCDQCLIKKNFKAS